MKEAKGQKAYDSFQIVGRSMLFRPTFTVLSPDDAAAVSSVHALVGPVLARLEGSENARYVIVANLAGGGRGRDCETPLRTRPAS